MEGKCSDSLARGDRLEDSQAEKLLQSAELNPLEILQKKMYKPLETRQYLSRLDLEGCYWQTMSPQWGGVKLFGEKWAKRT